MTDGPFRNSELTSRWKRYGDGLVNNATTVDERAAQACHSMMGEMDMKTFSPLLAGLSAELSRAQMDLDKVTVIERIFNQHAMSPLADILQKYVLADLRDQVPPKSVLERALDRTVQEWIRIAKNRLDEECIRARDLGDMKNDDYRAGMRRNGEAMAAIKPADLREALTSGNKSAFAHVVQKKSGVDDGPGE